MNETTVKDILPVFILVFWLVVWRLLFGRRYLNTWLPTLGETVFGGALMLSMLSMWGLSLVLCDFSPRYGPWAVIGLHVLIGIGAIAVLWRKRG